MSIESIEGERNELPEDFKTTEYFEIGEKFIHTKVSNYLAEKDSVVIYKVDEDERIFKLVEYKKYKEPWWLKAYKRLQVNATPNATPIVVSKWVIVIKFDINKLFSAKINVESLSKTITTSLGKTKSGTNVVTCVPSPLTEAEIHIFIDVNDIYNYLKSSMSKSKGQHVGSDSESRLCTPESYLFYNIRDVFIPEIKNVVVRGVPGINKIFVKKDPIGAASGGSGLKIDTQGVNLIDVLARTYNTPEVDIERTVCDDMHEIFNTLGIEAVRSFLIYEINRVLSFDGTYINIRHVSLLVDLMLRKGIITSVDRNGMGKDAGPLAAAMFEQTVKIITTCAANTEVDSMQSISSAVMLGELSQIGANTVKVVPRDRRPIM
jgi:DNA-directed RNA polymerase beta' subunit